LTLLPLSPTHSVFTCDTRNLPNATARNCLTQKPPPYRYQPTTPCVCRVHEREQPRSAICSPLLGRCQNLAKVGDLALAGPREEILASLRTDAFLPSTRITVAGQRRTCTGLPLLSPSTLRTRMASTTAVNSFAQMGRLRRLNVICVRYIKGQAASLAERCPELTTRT